MGDEAMGEAEMGDFVPFGIQSVAGTRPRAVLFDVVTRDFPLDANGKYQDQHPVDSMVDINMSMLATKIPTSSTTGNTLNQVTNPFGIKGANDIENRVRLRMKNLTDNGDIKIDSILSQPNPNGGFVVQMAYFNLRTSATKRRVATSPSLGG